MSRLCTICTHAQRAEIDAGIVAGQSLRDIAAKYRVSPDALSRHKAHVPLALARAPIVEVTADDLLGQMRALQARTLGILDKAEATGDLRTAVAAINQVRGNLELLARLLGELGELQSQTINVNILHSSEWLELRTLIVLALAPYPDARQAIAGVLKADDLRADDLRADDLRVENETSAAECAHQMRAHVRRFVDAER